MQHIVLKCEKEHVVCLVRIIEHQDFDLQLIRTASRLVRAILFVWELWLVHIPHLYAHFSHRCLFCFSLVLTRTPNELQNWCGTIHHQIIQCNKLCWIGRAPRFWIAVGTHGFPIGLGYFVSLRWMRAYYSSLVRFCDKTTSRSSNWTLMLKTTTSWNNYEHTWHNQ